MSFTAILKKWRIGLRAVIPVRDGAGGVMDLTATLAKSEIDLRAKTRVRNGADGGLSVNVMENNQDFRVLRFIATHAKSH